MGGSETTDWVGALEAGLEAAVGREEEVAAADLAFSLRQDVDVRAAIERSGSAWTLVGPGEARLSVDEVGLDYVRAGSLVGRTRSAMLRATPGTSPRVTDATFLEVLGSMARAGSAVVVNGLRGRLARVGKDHVAVSKDGSETIVGLAAVESVRLDDESGYSASRGFSG